MRKTNKMTQGKMRKFTEERLRRIARAGEVFIDGEAFKGVPVDPGLYRGDDYRVDHEKFITVKRALFKLKRLESGDVGVMTWRKFESDAVLTVVVDLDPTRTPVPGRHPVTPALAAAFEGRTEVQPLTINGVPVLSVCAPIRDSLDDVVGALEVFASLEPERYQADRINY